MKRFFQFFIILGLIVLCLPFVIYSAELRVVTENWKPYNYEDPATKKVMGVSTAVVKPVLDHTEIPYKIHVQPWNDSYQEALKQENVLIYTIMRTPQREKLFKWVRPLGQGGFSSLYKLRSNKDLRLTTLKDAKQAGKIATNENSMDHLWLKGNGFTNISLSDKVDGAIKKLYDGTAPLIIFNNIALEGEFATAGKDAKDVELVLPLFQTPPYMALSLATDNAILEKIQKSYDDLLSQNKIQLVD